MIKRFIIVSKTFSFKTALFTLVIIGERQFNGGGHPNASGVKNLTKEDIEAILIELHKAIHA